MTRIFAHVKTWAVLAGLLILAALPCLEVKAETLRVVTWNLGINPPTQNLEALLQRSADTLSSLNPDVVLLQGVLDWQMCNQLAGLLHQDEYHVVVCSSFRGASRDETNRTQVAVLSKWNAYFTWSEAWGSAGLQGLPRGIAFAALQKGERRIGVFSALSGPDQTPAELARRILGQIDSIGHWETNQVQALVIGTSLDNDADHVSSVLKRAADVFETAGFVDACEDGPNDLRTTLTTRTQKSEQLGNDRLLAGQGGFPMNGQVIPTRLTSHSPVVCDVELDPAQVSLALDIRGENQREKQARQNAQLRTALYWVGGALLCVAGLSAIFWKRRRHEPRSMAPERRKTTIARVQPEAQIRPILFADPPQRVVLPSRPKPVLRLQTTPRREDVTLPPRPLELDHPAIQGPPGMAERSQPEPDAHAPQAPPPLPEEVRHGVIQELSGWLKHKLVRRLTSDRSHLIQAQQLATRMANTLDTRLARIEAQIQQQNQAYIRRIEDLNKELAAARDENRELIRERIAQVKAEMEAARAKVLAEADLDNSQLRL